MNPNFSSALRLSFVITLLVGCASASAPLRQFAPPQADSAEQDFQPIVYGDSAAHAYLAPFFTENGQPYSYEEQISAPETLLGRQVGERMAHHAEIVAAFRLWEKQSPRLRVETYARSYEGRELIYALISSPENLKRIAEIRGAIHHLWDPRGLSDGEGERLCAETPAIAWMGYSIHGDETSGADATLAIAHHLIAAQSKTVADLLQKVVVVMDPVMNPDGRERFLAMVEQNSGYVTNLDYASLHRGRWPLGRGNHYLFDMNRDWMSGVAPETRGRWRLALAFHPQLFVDGHEMGALDTFLFYPQADPHLPALPATLTDWQKRFAAGASQAFDRQGWAYYTREWADAWAPFYSDAWGSLNGAIGMLYEQASFGGAPIKRASGRVVSYRQAVHAQALASMANLQTLAENRSEILRDYLNYRRKNCAPQGSRAKTAFVLVPGQNRSREAHLLATLLEQGIVVQRATVDFSGRQARNVLARKADEQRFPAGSYVVPLAQPQGSLVEAYLGFDPRMSEDFLRAERHELEREQSSKIYDITAWDLGSAYALDAWWCELDSVVGQELSREEVQSALTAVGQVLSAAGATAWGWVVDGADDRSPRFAAQAMELGLAVHLAQQSLRLPEYPALEFARGSLLVRRNENSASVEELVAQAARASQAVVYATSSGRAPDSGPDLGGQEFVLLARPRIALLANAPVERESYGHTWHYLDTDLRLPVTLLDAQEFGTYDLRRYNVLILPAAGDLDPWLSAHAAQLSVWVRGGGSLIACGSAAAALARAEHGLSGVRERSAVLSDIKLWQAAWERERLDSTASLDRELLWDGVQRQPQDLPATAPQPEPTSTPALEQERDAWLTRFAPSGLFLRAQADPESWLAYGSANELPVFFQGGHALYSRAPVRTAIRLSHANELRLGGLLWPEARERLAHSAWLTQESVGKGQLILFASSPTFRGYQRAGLRLFANAVVYGPGMGAEPAIDW